MARTSDSFRNQDRRVTSRRRLVPAILLLTAICVAGCRGGSGDRDARPVPAPDGWRVQRERHITLAVPGDWRRTSRVSDGGSEFVSLLSPREVDGRPQGVVIGRTEDVRPEDFLSIADTFRLVQGDRTYGAQREVDVEGSRRSILLESTRPLDRVTMRAWNVFVLTPGSVNLNVELVAPQELFDEGMFRQILDSMVVP